MSGQTDNLDLDLSPTAYALAAIDAWTHKINNNDEPGWPDLRTRIMAEWANRVDNVERHVQARLSGLVHNIREYGAIGDGKTDDTRAIQSALNESRARGGQVYLPRGRYRVTESLEYFRDDQIIGADPQLTVIDFQGSGYAFVSSRPGARTYNVVFQNFQINYSAASDGGIHLQDLSLALVQNIVVNGDVTNHGTGFLISGSTNGNAVYNFFLHSRCLIAENGFYVSSRGNNDTHILDCRAGGCTRGIYIVDSNHIVIRDSAIEANHDAIVIEATSSALADGITISGNRFENNRRYDVSIEGTANNVRHIHVTDNHHMTGTTPFNALTATFSPCIHSNSGAAGNITYTVSVASTGPTAYWETVTANVTAQCIRQSNIGSGSPKVLELSAGRLTSHAVSINSWDGTTDTENAYWQANGTIVAPNIQLSGMLSMTGASSAISLASNASMMLGDGVLPGNAQIIARSSAENTHTFFLFRKGTAATGNRFGWNFNSLNDLNLLSFDTKGKLHNILPFVVDYSPVDGRVETSMARPAFNRSTVLQSSNVALSAGWGNASSVVVAKGSNMLRGEITITPAGSGIASNPTVTITDPDGTWNAPPWTTAMRNGGTDTGITGFTVADTTTTIAFTLAGTPDGTYIIRWIRVG